MAAFDELDIDPSCARYFLTHLHMDHAGLIDRVVAQQPVEALDLKAEQIGGLEGFVKLGERDAVPGLFGGAVGSQRGSFPAFTVRTRPYPPLSDASWSAKRLLRRLDTGHLGHDKAQILRIP